MHIDWFQSWTDEQAREKEKKPSVEWDRKIDYYYIIYIQFIKDIREDQLSKRFFLSSSSI